MKALNLLRPTGILLSVLLFASVLPWRAAGASPTPTPRVQSLFGEVEAEAKPGTEQEELMDILGKENLEALTERGFDLSSLKSLLGDLDLSSLQSLLGEIDLSSLFSLLGDETASSSSSSSSEGAALTSLLDALGVTQRKIKDCDIRPIKDMIFSGKPLTPTPVVYYNERRLKKGTDFTVKYSDNTSVGTAKITIFGKGSYTGQKTLSFKIVASEDKKPSSASNTKCKVTLSQTTYSYTGKERKPTVKVMVSGKAVPKTGYTISFNDNIKVGIATVTVKGKGDYKGLSGEATFKIELKKTALKSLSAKSEGTLEASWTADTQADGYEVQSCTNKSFSSKTLIKQKVTGGKKSSCSFSGLVSGKKYYVRLRSYKKVGRETWYCTWSAPKEATVK